MIMATINLKVEILFSALFKKPVIFGNFLLTKKLNTTH